MQFAFSVHGDSLPISFAADMQVWLVSVFINLVVIFVIAEVVAEVDVVISGLAEQFFTILKLSIYK